MTVELLQILSLVSFIVAGVFLLVSVALFFLLDVPKLYGELSGRTAKKAIEAIRQQNETSGNKALNPSTVNQARGKLTERISTSGKISKSVTVSGIGVGTQKFATSELAPQAAETTVLGGNETTVLSNGGETTVLASSGNETTVLTQSTSETTILTQTAAETTVLRQAENMESAGSTSTLPYAEPMVSEAISAKSHFVLEVEMYFASSTEIIE